MSFSQCFDDGVEVVGQAVVVAELQGTRFQLLGHARGNHGVGLALHGPPTFGERNDLLPLVFRSALSGHDAQLLHALQQRCHRVGFEVQPAGNVVHGHRVAFPQHQQHQILRIRDAQLAQDGRVGLRHQSCCRVESEADLAVEL